MFKKNLNGISIVGGLASFGFCWRKFVFAWLSASFPLACSLGIQPSISVFNQLSRIKKHKSWSY